MKTPLILMMLVIPLGLMQRAHGENIVINGDFEEPYVEHDWINFPGGTSFPGWQVGGHSIDVVANVGMFESWSAASGRQSVDLNGFGPGSISQQMSLEPGISYDLRFALAGNVVGGGIIVTMDWLLDSEVIDTLMFDTTGHDGVDVGWTYHTYSFVAESDVATLTFRSLSQTGRRGPALDDVSVRIVPEGSSVLAGLVLLALAGAGGFLTRSRRRRA